MMMVSTCVAEIPPPLTPVDMATRLNNLNTPALPPSFSTLPSLQTQTPGYDQGMANGNYHDVQGYGGHAVHSAPTHAPAPPMAPAPAPMSIPEIRTEADLAMFNQFMLSLGRDAARSAPAPVSIPQTNGLDLAPAMTHAGSHFSSSNGSGTSPSLSGQSPIEDLFNPEELASLGLSGMPGIPNNPFAAPPNNTTLYGDLYNQLEQSKRVIAGLPRNAPNPRVAPIDYSSYQVPQDMPSFDMNFGSFDSLAPSKAPPIATLAPRDFQKKTYRHVAPLGAAVSSRTVESAERTEFAEADEMESNDDARLARMDEPTRKLSVADLLLSDDQADPGLKLPRIHRATSNEHLESPHLPGVSALKPSSPPRHPHVPIKRHTEDDIVRGVKRLEIDELVRSPKGPENEDDDDEERLARLQGRRHALMIRSWLVAVNLEFRSRKLRELSEDAVQDDEVDELDVDEDDIGDSGSIDDNSLTPTERKYDIVK